MSTESIPIENWMPAMCQMPIDLERNLTEACSTIFPQVKQVHTERCVLFIADSIIIINFLKKDSEIVTASTNSSAEMESTPNTPLASKQVNGKTSPDAANNLDKAIADVLHEIKGLDKGIKKMNERRMQLTAKYDALNETRQMYASEAIANEQNWESGKFDENNLMTNLHIYSSSPAFHRNVQLVSVCSRDASKRVQTAQISTTTITNDKLYYGQEGRADDCSDRWREKFVLPIAGDHQRRPNDYHFTAHLADGGSSVVSEKDRNRSRITVGRHRQKPEQSGAETNDGEIECL